MTCYLLQILQFDWPKYGINKVRLGGVQKNGQSIIRFMVTEAEMHCSEGEYTLATLGPLYFLGWACLSACFICIYTQSTC